MRVRSCLALFCVVTAAVAAMAATSAHATSDANAPNEMAEPGPKAGPVVIDKVVVQYPKNAAVMAYDEAYERLKRLQDSKLDRVRLQIMVKPKDPNVKPSDVRAAIVSDTVTVPLLIAADGTVNLPLRPDLYKVGAEIRSNQPKGTMEASVNFGVSWSAGKEVPYAEIEETARQIQVAGKDLMGWFGYLLFFPSLANFEVPVQYPVPNGQTMTVMKDNRVIERYTADSKGLLTFRLKRNWAGLQPTLVFSEPMPPQ
jgi:hypothetical protein